MPSFEKNCTSYIREREGWIRWWFGTTREEAERNFRTNPDGDLTQHLPAKEFTDEGDCTCPPGYERVLLSDKSQRGVARGNMRVYRRLAGDCPMIIASVYIERTIPFATRIRCEEVIASASIEVPSSLKDPREIAKVRELLARRIRLPVSLRRQGKRRGAKKSRAGSRR